MSRLIKLFQSKSNQAFEKYLLERKKIREYPDVQSIVVGVLKAESDTWAKAAELLRKEEIGK